MALKIPELRFKIEGPILIMYTSLCKNHKRFRNPLIIISLGSHAVCCVCFIEKGKISQIVY